MKTMNKNNCKEVRDFSIEEWGGWKWQQEILHYYIWLSFINIEYNSTDKCIEQLNEGWTGQFQEPIFDQIHGSKFTEIYSTIRKDVITRVKQKNNLVKDAEGLSENREPDYVFKNVTPKEKKQRAGIIYDIEIWDEENFNWSNVNKFLRVLKVKERKKKINKHKEILKEETQICYYATTMEKINLKAFTVWKIAHRRWDEENRVFHWLKTHWNFDHIYSSDPEVIQTMYYLYIITYNLFHLYIHRNLRSFDTKRETKKKFLRRFYKGLVRLNKPLYYPGADPG